ncbi:glucuronoxylan 4-O-methyltransferase 2 [Andrographis paniculata]|uniref:glucuronoxylan 4-O-methyltransferase 2 n=1 Tax=Andrographis paniculata TaxID=175694 RepID=UPI0021E8B345|nr:glucuronoxylan 4-O-methyltransferase 2 [Andrographis paniculata]
MVVSRDSNGTLLRPSTHSRLKPIFHRKYCQEGNGGRMKLTKRKLVPVLAFILCTASAFRFLNISMVTTSSSRLPWIVLRECSSTSPLCIKNISRPHENKKEVKAPCRGSIMSKNERILTRKEIQFLFDFISTRLPCNLLIFGSEREYSSIAHLNAGGVTIFLDENHHVGNKTVLAINARVFRVTYNTVASEAYQLLKVARENLDCVPKIRLPKCILGLSNLPEKVYDTKWDVVVVDGPRGDTPDSPGRMASIYTAGVMARRGNTTDVFVHDADRMVEKWFSREFLCEENLVSSKGRFQHFRIQGAPNATKFCTS